MANLNESVANNSVATNTTHNTEERYLHQTAQLLQLNTESIGDNLPQSTLDSLPTDTSTVTAQVAVISAPSSPPKTSTTPTSTSPTGTVSKPYFPEKDDIYPEYEIDVPPTMVEVEGEDEEGILAAVLVSQSHFVHV